LEITEYTREDELENQQASKDLSYGLLRQMIDKITKITKATK